MLRIFVIMLATVASVATAAPVTPVAVAAPANERQFDIKSAITGRTYRIWFSRPSKPPPPAGYALAMFVDGNSMYRQSADQMAIRGLVDLKPAVIVAIGYPTDDILDIVRLRTLDLTPTAPTGVFLPLFDSWAKYGHYTRAETGGAEAFYRFISEELRPKLAQLLPVDPGDQALYGHSLGGLFTLHVLFNHPKAFRSYLVSSPSIVWNAREILGKIDGFQAQVERDRLVPRVLLTAGSLENYPNSAQAAAMTDE